MRHLCFTRFKQIKVGLEAKGHYSYNLLVFLLDNGLHTYVLNPLHTNLYRKSLSLRKTKTDVESVSVVKKCQSISVKIIDELLAVFEFRRILSSEHIPGRKTSYIHLQIRDKHISQRRIASYSHKYLSLL